MPRRATQRRVSALPSWAASMMSSTPSRQSRAPRTAQSALARLSCSASIRAPSGMARLASLSAPGCA
eukprot:5173342-Alexandrium_andersonii.AAC.1